MFTSTSGHADGITIPPFDTSRLRDWSLSHGVELTDDVRSLEDLDSKLDEWYADPYHFDSVDLGNEAGMYVGNVIVRSVAGSRWRAWPNGHPVISVGSRKDLDVIALVADRILRKGPSLPSIYDMATRV